MNGLFSFLREDSSIDEFYDVGPWADEEAKYLEPDLNERFHHEILDICTWLEPTESERKIRLLVIKRFTNIIEKYYPGSIVIPQGSSATDTFLPVSDIDLIVLNLPENTDVCEALRVLTKLFLKSKMISNYKIIDHASVPIAKLTERPFGFSIDVCASNINGALNIPRVRKIVNSFPLFKPVLMFLKLFIYVNQIDDPASGGFGSNQIINMVHFAFQSRPDLANNAGQIILYLFDLFANKFNYILVGISTVDGGRLFSKLHTELISGDCPQALIFEDPQFRNNYIGKRTGHSLSLANICRSALHSIAYNDYVKCSTVTSFLPDIDNLIERRCALERFGRLFDKSLYEFSRTTDEIPNFIPRGQHPLPPFMQREKETSLYDPKKALKMKEKKKQKRVMKKQQALMNQIKSLRDQEEKNRKNRKKQKMHLKPQINRGSTPPRYKR